MEIILFLFGTIAGLVISFGIYGALTFIIESLFGRKIYTFKYLFFNYTPSMGLHICHFSPVCEISMTKENDTEKQQIASAVIKMILYYAACVAVIFFTIKIYQSKILSLFPMALVAGVAAWFGLDGFMRIFFLIQSVVNSKNPNNLSNKYNEIINKMMNGAPFGEIEVPDLRITNFKAEKGVLTKYQHLFFMNRVWHGDEAGIAYAVQTMEHCIGINYAVTEKSYLLNFIEIYYDLLFYYSYFYFDTQHYRAKKIFDIIAPDLLKDNDSNGYRTLAYYAYYIDNNEDLAEKCIKKGLELIDEFPIVSQREYEKMLLTKLSEKIYC